MAPGALTENLRSPSKYDKTSRSRRITDSVDQEVVDLTLTSPSGSPPPDVRSLIYGKNNGNTTGSQHKASSSQFPMRNSAHKDKANHQPQLGESTTSQTNRQHGQAKSPLSITRTANRNTLSSEETRNSVEVRVHRMVDLTNNDENGSKPPSVRMASSPRSVVRSANTSTVHTPAHSPPRSVGDASAQLSSQNSLIRMARKAIVSRPSDIRMMSGNSDSDWSNSDEEPNKLKNADHKRVKASSSRHHSYAKVALKAPIVGSLVRKASNASATTISSDRSAVSQTRYTKEAHLSPGSPRSPMAHARDSRQSLDRSGLLLSGVSSSMSPPRIVDRGKAYTDNSSLVSTVQSRSPIVNDGQVPTTSEFALHEGQPADEINVTESSDNIADNMKLSAPQQHRFRLPLTMRSKVQSGDNISKPISIGAYRSILDEHITRSAQDHAYLVQNVLKRTRLNLAVRDQHYVQKRSPFEGMTSIRCDSSIRANTGKFGHFVKGTNERNTVLTIYGRTSYEQIVPAVPPYTCYISAKRNILTEDDKQRTFFPHHEDDYEVAEEAKEYAELELKIEQNTARYYRLSKIRDQARLAQYYAEGFLAEIGCSPEAVLHYLFNENNPPAPMELSPELREYWKLRTEYLKDGYYEVEDDQEAIDREDDSPPPARPEKQWQYRFQELDDQINRPSSQQLAAACIACKVFQDKTGFSLFHVVSKFAETPELLHHKNSLETYMALVCFICKSHECPGHGQFEDNDEDKNIRERVNYKPGLPDNDVRQPPYRVNEDPVVELLGLDDDGEIKGKPWANLVSGNPGFADAELCSDDCFWARQARVTSLPEWSEEDISAFKMLRPAYEFERRGPCLITQTGIVQRPCKEIFLRLLLDLPVKNEYSWRLRNEQESGSTMAPPRRTVDQWKEDRRSELCWKQEEREPFLPCDHLGLCTEDTKDCVCWHEGVFCEKSCACAKTCIRRYQGCKCHGRGKTCKTDSTCECRKLHRECDPDLCGTCGADIVLDPANRHNEEAIQGRCYNVCIQRGVPKRTLLGESKLMADGGKSGWGLYMGEECKKGDYIGEYRGEIVSEIEADQRGTIYDQQAMSYLFTLNKAQVLDGTKVGNKMRFINHQEDPHSNVYARILLCNGVVRIGMFASKDITIGEEMFFNYGEGFSSRFDMIKMNMDGTVSVERKDPQARLKHRSFRRSDGTRPSAYQLKNKISKNGRRLGRPPKHSRLAELSSPVPQSSRTTSRKRRRSESEQDNDLDVPDVDTQSQSDKDEHTEDEQEEEEPRRKRRRRRAAVSVSVDSDDEPVMSIRQNQTRSARSTVGYSSQKSPHSKSSQTIQQSTPSVKIEAPDAPVVKRGRGRPRKVRPETNAEAKQSSQEARVEEEKVEVEEEEVEEEEESEDLTPRRSSRRRQEKQHFGEDTSQNSTPSGRRTRLARKSAR